MVYQNLEIMQKFTEKNLPSLCETVLGTLELFEKEGLPKTKFKNFKRPLVVGSGNAIVTAKFLLEDKDAIFADETNFEQQLRKNVDGVIIFSASGGKHAPILAEAALKAKKQVQLVTCNKTAPAIEIVGKENTIITPKNREPYTYNTSTYMGWIFAKTQEDPKKIREFILNKVTPILPKNFKKYTGYLLVTPNEFSGLNQLFIVKFIELFGRVLARDVKSFEELKHAITVVPSKTEKCIQFGKGKVDFPSRDILKIPLPKNCGPAAMMAIAYYVIGRIQDQYPQYFKKHIGEYLERNSKGSFGKVMNVIVE